MTILANLADLLPDGFYIRYVQPFDESVDPAFEVCDASGPTGVDFGVDPYGPFLSFFDGTELTQWPPRDWHQIAAIKADLAAALAKRRK